MHDLTYIQNLLAILKTHKVKHIKMHGLELMFHGEQGYSENSLNWDKLTTPPHPSDLHAHQEHQPDSTELIANTIRKQEEALPIDLRADSLMDQDKILNWSSPDQIPNEPELPLTGEQPL